MRILIIGTPRSGTSTLTNGLGRCFNYQIISEPFNSNFIPNPKNTRYKNGFFNIPDNVVLKTISNQRPQEVMDKKIDIMDFYEGFIPIFDKIILLSRKNKLNLFESYTFAKDSNSWHVKWVKVNELDCTKYELELNNNIKTFHRIVEKYNYEITWYEDLYSGDEIKIKDILEKWNIPGLEYDCLFNYINPKHKYRQDDNYNKKLL